MALNPYETTLTVLKIATVLFGLVFLYYTLRAYRKHRARSMLILFVAVGLMTAAAVAEGVAFAVLGLSLEQAHIVEAVFTLAAFAVLVYSIFAHRVVRAEARHNDE